MSDEREYYGPEHGCDEGLIYMQKQLTDEELVEFKRAWDGTFYAQAVKVNGELRKAWDEALEVVLAASPFRALQRLIRRFAGRLES